MRHPTHPSAAKVEVNIFVKRRFRRKGVPSSHDIANGAALSAMFGTGCARIRAMTSRRFPAPWRADKMPGGYVVRDANGQALDQRE
jgi:hypothetical protein